MDQIKECSIFKENKVCLMKKNCKNPPTTHRLWLWSNKMNKNECKCKEEYSF